MSVISGIEDEQEFYQKSKITEVDSITSHDQRKGNRANKEEEEVKDTGNILKDFHKSELAHPKADNIVERDLNHEEKMIEDVQEAKPKEVERLKRPQKQQKDNSTRRNDDLDIEKEIPEADDSLDYTSNPAFKKEEEKPKSAHEKKEVSYLSNKQEAKETSQREDREEKVVKHQIEAEEQHLKPEEDHQKEEDPVEKSLDHNEKAGSHQSEYQQEQQQSDEKEKNHHEEEEHYYAEKEDDHEEKENYKEEKENHQQENEDYHEEKEDHHEEIEAHQKEEDNKKQEKDEEYGQEEDAEKENEEEVIDDF